MWNWVKNIFNFFKRVFTAFVDEAIDEIGKRLTALFKNMAVDIVAELAKTDLTNSEKRKEAFKKIKKAIFDSGEEASDSFINWLTETAYQKFKNGVK